MSNNVENIVNGAFIENKLVPVASDVRVPVVDPTTGAVFTELHEAGKDEVDAAVAAGRHALEQGEWGRLAGFERGRLLAKLSQAILDNADELVALESRDTGKPLGQARADIVATARYFEFYAGAADKMHGETIPYFRDFFVATEREPHGVVAHIIPWNYPAQMFGRNVAPSLAVGNAAVVKPAEDACLSVLRMAQLSAEVGFPAGALAVLPGRGSVTGAALSAHDDIDYIAFTGSPGVGEMIQVAAARRAIGCTLELGGKSPHVVFGDADLSLAVPAIVNGIVNNAGQTCSAGSRVLVERAHFDRIVGAIANAFSKLRAGSPEMNVDLGPVINQRQRERIERYCEQARADGIPLLAEGSIEAGTSSDGFFVAPRLYGPVDPSNILAREEVFGPVLCVIPFEDDADALRLANDSEFGLLAGIWTRDGGRGLRLARKIRAGQVYINGFAAGGGIELPFGGVKRSGHGREKGLAAMEELSTVKTIIHRHG
ncbi:aldehyde dehydrogenase family protein [Sphingomonas sp. CL5.1]|uniref:aldehyde dehydrogenase family protein n=1 Tax=Sphingomonas sp. CL5.1 TaxID=2653203 RepID=UPI0015835E3A|nr:aldehyde dehydrogenase family protein [Sphingomonas sp. CL5.1]QKS00240.1 aldehyde dehydrogenase family protein [Sphingomonas sp. CL5.1]